MKKIIIAKDLAALAGMENSFLNRADVRLTPADTTDEVLALHRRQMADLIILPVDLPGTGIELVCSIIRTDPVLRGAQLMLICPNTRQAIEQTSRCRPNAVVLRPVNAGLLLSRAQQLLDVPSRETYRVLINISVDSIRDNSTFFCRSQDISATGMLIETDRTLTHGASLKCSFFLPDSTRIQASAEVVRTLGSPVRDGVNRYGVRFIQIGPQERKALEDFIEQKSGVR